MISYVKLAKEPSPPPEILNASPDHSGGVKGWLVWLAISELENTIIQQDLSESILESSLHLHLSPFPLLGMDHSLDSWWDISI